MSAGDRHRLAPGAARVRDRFSESFFSFLWKHPDIRKCLGPRHRNEVNVREVADHLQRAEQETERLLERARDRVLAPTVSRQPGSLPWRVPGFPSRSLRPACQPTTRHRSSLPPGPKRTPWPPPSARPARCGHWR
jgi:hypothetical protein